MRDRDAAFDGMAKSGRRAASISRIARLAVTLILAQIVQPLDARASVTCVRIDKLQSYTDPAIAAVIERNYGTTDVFVGGLSNRFYFVRLGPANCGKPGCLYRLIQVTDGAIQEKFAFHSTGWTLWLSPVALYFEPLKDYYATVAVEAPEKDFVVIRLPKAGNLVLVDAWSGASQPRCGRFDN